MNPAARNDSATDTRIAYNRNMGNRSTPNESIFDSPWYWGYVFITAALAVLFLAQGRFQSRQAQIENKYQGRQRAVRQLSGAAPTTPLSTPQNTLVKLGPIFLTLGLLFLVTGFGVVRRWRRLWNSASESHAASDGRHAPHAESPKQDPDSVVKVN